MKARDLTRLAMMVCFCLLSGRAIGQSISGIINSYHRITYIGVPTNSLTVASAAGLVPGTKVLVIQMKGAVINNGNAASFGDITDAGQAGNYEFNYICAVSGNDILLTHQLAHAYNVTGSVQLVTVPRYNIITISGNVTAASWDPVTQTGGVVAFDADTVYLNNNIDVSGQGFKGGGSTNFSTPVYDCSWAVNVTNYYLQLSPVPDQYYSGGPKGEGIAPFILNAEYGRGKQANGGGGGNNHNTGGAGGANAGAGGDGGRRTNESFFLCHGSNPGIGGTSLSSFGYSPGNNRIFMGGGGGSGHQNNGKGTTGGNGGGIVIIKASTMIGNGSIIQADGSLPANLSNVDVNTAEGDGGGGGGAGGTIVLNVTQVLGSVAVSARGGRGSDASRGVNDCTGPGGGGGGGILWMKGASIPSTVSAVVSGGSNGVVSMLSGVVACQGMANGATSGGSGALLANYIAPATGNFLCAPLPVQELKFFEVKKAQTNIYIRWSMFEIRNISSYEVERSTDQVHYSTIEQLDNNAHYTFTVTDNRQFDGIAYYRLKIFRKDGTIGYSKIITVAANVTTVLENFNLFPNPVVDVLNVSIFSRRNVTTKFRIYNSTGECLYMHQFNITRGYNQFTVPVKSFLPGMYWLTIEANGIQERRKFVKQY